MKHILPLLLLFVWLSKDFMLFSSALAFKNSLPQVQRERAYIVPIKMGGHYAVVYPDA